MNEESKRLVLSTMTAAGYGLLSVTSRSCHYEQVGTKVTAFEFKGDIDYITLNVYDGNLQRISVFCNHDHATLPLDAVVRWLKRDPRSMLESGV